MWFRLKNKQGKSASTAIYQGEEHNVVETFQNAVKLEDSYLDEIIITLEELKKHDKTIENIVVSQE